MKRAFDTVTDHAAAMSEVGAEVFAMRFQHMQLPRLVAVGDQVLAKVPQRPDFTR